MYPELMVIPMREELTRAGIQEARTADDVDAALKQTGTTMIVVNSICGCAAGKMRPGVRLALHYSGPLVSAHSAGAGVRKQVDKHIVGTQEKEIVMRGFQQFFALCTSRPADWFHTLDAEWLDDGSY